MWPSPAGVYILAVLGLVGADYCVDSANDTVTLENSTRNITLVLSDGNFTVDSSKCYDQNYALANCTVDNKCQITFPFTGSGVSVRVMHAGFQGTTAALTIDGNQTVTATLPAPVPPLYQTPNVSLFNLQSLPSADHTAIIDILNWNNGTTSLYFDYALINESDIESTNDLCCSSSSVTTSFASSTHTSGVTPSVSDADSGANLGIVVGSACGGLASLIAIAMATIFLKKRKSRYAELAESGRPDPFPVALSHLSVRFASSPVPAHLRTNEQMHIHFAAPLRSPVQSDGNSSDPRMLSAAANAGKIPEADPGSSIANPFSHDRLPGGRPSTDSFGSVVRSASCPPVAPNSASSSNYQVTGSKSSNASDSSSRL